MRSNNMPEIIVRDGDAYVHMGSLEDAGQKPLNKWLLKPTTDAYIRTYKSASATSPRNCAIQPGGKLRLRWLLGASTTGCPPDTAQRVWVY